MKRKILSLAVAFAAAFFVCAPQGGGINPTPAMAATPCVAPTIAPRTLISSSEINGIFQALATCSTNAGKPSGFLCQSLGDCTTSFPYPIDFAYGAKLGINGAGSYFASPQIGFTTAQQYGAKCDNATDDAAAINSAIAALTALGGGSLHLSGTCLVSSSINLAPSVFLVGAGSAPTISPKSPFVGSCLICITGATNVGISNLLVNGGQSSTVSSNPAIDAISIASSTGVFLSNLKFYLNNGWLIKSKSSSLSNVTSEDVFVNGVTANIVAKGIDFDGTSASNNSSSSTIENADLENLSAGQALYLNGIHDVTVNNFICYVSGGTTPAMTLRGATGAVYMSNLDCGDSTNQPVLQSVADSSQTPSTPENVSIVGGQFGTPGTTYSSGADLALNRSHLAYLTVNGSQCSGVVVEPGSSQITLTGIHLRSDNASNSSACYEINELSTSPVLFDQITIETTSPTVTNWATSNRASWLNSYVYDGHAGYAIFNGAQPVQQINNFDSAGNAYFGQSQERTQSQAWINPNGGTTWTTSPDNSGNLIYTAGSIKSELNNLGGWVSPYGFVLTDSSGNPKWIVQQTGGILQFNAYGSGNAVTVDSAGNLNTSGNIASAGSVFSLTLSTPTDTGSCTAGQIRWDASYLYVCTATNTWKRSALSSF